MAFLFAIGTLASLVALANAAYPRGMQQAEDEAKLSADVIRQYNEGKYDEALPLAKRLLAIRETVAGKDSLRVAIVLNTIGSLYLNREKYFEASPYFERSLKITETVLGKGDPTVAQILDRLALINYVKGEHGSAEEQYRRALAIREGVLGPTNIEVLNSLSKLADFYEQTGDYKKAEEYLQRSIAAKESASDPSTNGLAETIYQYACLKRKMNEPDSAKDLESRAARLMPIAPDRNPGVAPTEAGIVNGRALKLTKPPYPVEAKRRATSGDVRVRVLIDEAGKVIRACAITGPSVFSRVSEAAAYHSLFSPTTLDGKPVKIIGRIEYHFNGN
jgi:tetratricopeptide (TPR) repeat protein